MSAVGNLWRTAAPWRWLTSAALIGTVLVGYLEVTPTYHPASKAQSAAYDAAAQRRAAAAAAPADIAPPPRAASGAGAPYPTITPSPGAPSAPLPPAEDAAGARSAASPPGTRPLGGSVTFVKGEHEGAVSGGGLVASYCCAGASATVAVSRAVTSGRHYYEIELRTRRGERNPDTWTSAGVMKQGGRGGPPLPPGVQVRDASRYSVISWGSWKRYNDGDVLMFALDMDRGFYYYGVNGAWANAVPGRDAGLPLERGTPYLPYVTVSASSSHPDKDTDKWIGNFGQNAFRYVPPAGFGAYGSGTTVASSSPPSSGSTIAPVAPDTSVQGVRSGLMGKSFVDTMPLGGAKIPLPDGTWTVVAFMRGGSRHPETEIAVLANVVNKKLAGLVTVSVYVDPRKSGTGFPPSSFCGRTDYFARETRANETSGRQECWWINHAAQVWTQNTMRAARAELELRGVSDFPDTMVNVGVWLADPNKYVNMLVYFDPRSEGVQTPPSSWEASEWNRTRIASYPDKEQYAKKLESFGRSWIQIVRANF